MSTKKEKTSLFSFFKKKAVHKHTPPSSYVIGSQRIEKNTTTHAVPTSKSEVRQKSPDTLLYFNAPAENSRKSGPSDVRSSQDDHVKVLYLNDPQSSESRTIQETSLYQNQTEANRDEPKEENPPTTLYSVGIPVPTESRLLYQNQIESFPASRNSSTMINSTTRDIDNNQQSNLYAQTPDSETTNQNKASGYIEHLIGYSVDPEYTPAELSRSASTNSAPLQKSPSASLVKSPSESKENQPETAKFLPRESLSSLHTVHLQNKRGLYVAPSSYLEVTDKASSNNPSSRIDIKRSDATQQTNKVNNYQYSTTVPTKGSPPSSNIIGHQISTDKENSTENSPRSNLGIRDWNAEAQYFAV
jgi:hypothetical protein